MSKIKILIIEDELELGEDLKFSLEEIGYEISGIAPDLKEAFGLFYAQNPDIVIVDIMLGDKDDGITFVKRINENPLRRKPIIFLTGMDDKTIFEKAKKTGPFSYLLKPFNILELQFAIELSIDKFIGEENIFSSSPTSVVPMRDSFFVKNGNNIIKLEFSDIRYISVEHKYSDIYLKEKKYSILLSLKDVAKELPNSFVHVHRNHIVNLVHVEKLNIKDNIVYLKNGTHLSVSKRMKDNLIEKLNLIG